MGTDTYSGDKDGLHLPPHNLMFFSHPSDCDNYSSYDSIVPQEEGCVQHTRYVSSCSGRFSFSINPTCYSRAQGLKGENRGRLALRSQKRQLLDVS